MTTVLRRAERLLLMSFYRATTTRGDLQQHIDI